MAQFWTNFSGYTTGVGPSDWELGGAAYAAGDITVENVSGSISGKGLVFNDVGATGGRYLTATWDGTSTANQETVIRFRAPNGFQQYYGGVGALARVDRTAFYRTAYAARTSHQGFTGRNVIVRGSMNNSPGTELGYANVFSDPPASATWLYQRIRCNGTNIRAWWWVQGDAAKTNSDTPDVEVIDSTYTAGYAGIVRDFQDTWYSGVDLEVDMFGVGTDGDSAPITAPGGTNRARARLATLGVGR